MVAAPPNPVKAKNLPPECHDSVIMRTPSHPRVRMQNPSPLPIVLASTSSTRRALLARLAVPFEMAAPHVDETRHGGEDPRALALRLARAKAHALAAHHPRHLLVGADQVAALGDEVFGKPADHQAATDQLRNLSGQTVRYFSALCVLNTATGATQDDVIEDRVTLRRLEAEEIERYLRHDRPFDCAGSLRSEGLGIALCARIESTDPSALLGLPLIRLTQFLRAQGYLLP